MKRDRELQRLLLLQVRDGQAPPELSNYPEAEQVYNSALLINDGYVDGKALRGNDGQYVSTVMMELTSSGHDLLDRLTPESEGSKQKLGKAGLSEEEGKQNEPALDEEPDRDSSAPKEPSDTESRKQQQRIRIGGRTIFT